METLKNTLFTEYGGFSDKRIKIKDLNTFNEFFVDGRTKGDIASNKKPFGWLCVMTLTVVTRHQVELVLSGNIPTSPKIEKWITDNLLPLDGTNGGRLSITVTPNNVQLLESLATLIANITMPGARYSVADYKYACPKASNALNLLSRVLKKKWGC